MKKYHFYSIFALLVACLLGGASGCASAPVDSATSDSSETSTATTPEESMSTNTDIRKGWVMVESSQDYLNSGTVGEPRYVWPPSIARRCVDGNLLYATVTQYSAISQSLTVIPDSPECAE